MILADHFIQRMQVHHHLVPPSRFHANLEAIGIGWSCHAPSCSDFHFSDDRSWEKMTSSKRTTASRGCPLGTPCHPKPSLWRSRLGCMGFGNGPGCDSLALRQWVWPVGRHCFPLRLFPAPLEITPALLRPACSRPEWFR